MRKVVAAVLVGLSVWFPIAPVAQAGFSGKDLILPAVGRVEGFGGSNFYTTVWVTNPSTTEAVGYEMALLESGHANPAPVTVTDTLAPGATRAYENAAETLFNFRGVGGLRVRSTGRLLVSSRIYNQNAADGVSHSQGLYSAAVPAEFGITTGQSGVLQGVRQSVDFRYNVMIVESTGQQLGLDLAVVNSAGTTLGTRSLSLSAYEHQMINVAAIYSGSIDDAVLHVTATRGDGRAIVLGSQ
ncbi:MAG TPA: hypothetical protein VF911_06225, partial [Thermoanaerobaculia bacterium]